MSQIQLTVLRIQTTVCHPPEIQLYRRLYNWLIVDLNIATPIKMGCTMEHLSSYIAITRSRIK